MPLFLRSGYLIFRQDTTNITKSRQLNNLFSLVGAFKLVSSTSLNITYAAEGGLLSILDYNYEAEIEKCLAEDCDYAIRAVLIVNKLNREKQLVLNYEFNGKSVKYSQ